MPDHDQSSAAPARWFARLEVWFIIAGVLLGSTAALIDPVEPGFLQTVLELPR